MEDTTQRASQIGSGLTSRFRSQLSSFDNYSRSRNMSLQGTADAYRQNLIAKNSLTGLEEIESYLLDALNNTSNSSFVSEHGTIERWVGGKVKKERINELEKVIKKTKQNIKNKIK